MAFRASRSSSTEMLLFRISHTSKEDPEEEKSADAADAETLNPPANAVDKNNTQAVPYLVLLWFGHKIVACTHLVRRTLFALLPEKFRVMLVVSSLMIGHFLVSMVCNALSF